MSTSQQTLETTLIMEDSTSPITLGGVAAPVGSYLTAEDGSGFFYKSGAADLDWEQFAYVNDPIFTGTVTIDSVLLMDAQTASRVAIIDASKNLISADTATYPSLTELSYLKGCPNAIAYGTTAGTFAEGDDSRFPVNGTYTPTVTNVANIGTVVMADANYTRLNNSVIVSGSFTLDPTSASVATAFRIDLPIASNFSSVGDVGGAANCQSVNQHLSIRADVGNDEAQFQGVPSSAANQTYSFIFQYIIL